MKTISGALLSAAWLCAWTSTAVAASGDTELPAVEVEGHYDNAVGSSDAASEGSVTAKLIRNRPMLRAAEVLEFVPGVIVSQHSGDGKANQYYLRGFNLDHGTDFATFVDDMPVNMPSHAHGQGYTDLNFLIPELVSRIHYRKGVYAAEDGDFSSAGSARIGLINRLPTGLLSVTGGENGYARGLIANSLNVVGGDLLYALEAAHNDGPWEFGENFRRVNGLLRYTRETADSRSTLTAMHYDARWDATDQVPQRAIDSGRIGRFGAIDPSDHGETRRSSLSWGWHRQVDDGHWDASAYAISSHLDLFSNFTYFLDNPDTGDQFEQAEDRRVFGGKLSRSWTANWGGREVIHTLGLQTRYDRLDPVGLYTAVLGERDQVTQESRLSERALGLYAQTDLAWNEAVRTVFGWRADHVDVDVDSSIAENSGSRSDWIHSPKLALILSPWDRTEVFASAGYGFHSNDARGMTARVTARGGEPIDPAVPLVRSRGTELGLRNEWLPGLQSSLAIWQLKLDSELVFVGDAGETEPNGGSQRRGIEFNNHYVLNQHWMLDLDLAWSRARFDEIQGDEPNAGRHVPGSVQRVAALGITFNDLGPWFGQLQLRYFGPRPLIEDNSVRSDGTTLAYARIGYQLSPNARLSLDVFNLFDAEVSDIDYYYASRLPDEPAEGVLDIHTHPAEPRTARVTLSMGF